MVLLIASVFLAGVYAAIMIMYLRGWKALPEWQMPEGFGPQISVSVIIAARNEASNIEACLRSIVLGSYPPGLLEIIVVDDFSDDATAETVLRMQRATGGPAIRLIRLSDLLPPAAGTGANKKKALETGIANARGILIVTTDADCEAPADWLKWVASRFQTASKEGEELVLLASPVAFHREKNLFQRFQSLDFLGLMGITAAGLHTGFQHMGNGANLAFRKTVFREVGGYEGSEHLASGDDMFLIRKIVRRYPAGVFFLKNAAATVLTEAKPDVRSFFQQRLRWGTKNAAFPEWPVRLVLLAVFLFCWSILINSLLLAACFVLENNQDTIVGIQTGRLLLPVLLLQLGVKAGFDYLFLREMCRFFKREDLLSSFVYSFFLHTLYIPLVGTASLFWKKYHWKGRRVR